MRFDMHVHTCHSERCGWMRPEQLVKKAIERGLDGLAVTDHDAISGALEVSDIVKDNNIKIFVIIGEEVATDRGEVLAYFIDREIDPGPLMDVLSEIRNAGGLSAVPHPFDRIRRGFVDLDAVIDEFDAIETLNSRCLFNSRALKFSQTHKVTALGGSDAHFYSEVGRAWTDIPDDLKTSIKSGRTQVGGSINNPAFLALTKGVKIWRGLIYPSA